MTQRQCRRKSVPIYSVEAWYILDRMALECDEEEKQTFSLLKHDNEFATWYLSVTPKLADADTVAVGFRLCDAIDVDCSMNGCNGMQRRASVKLEVRQESDVERDQVTVHETPGWTSCLLSSPHQDYTIPCLRDFKVIPSLKNIHIKLSVKWRRYGAEESTFEPTDDTGGCNRELIIEDPQFIVKKLQALLSPPHKLSDVVFLVQGEEIPAHRLILAAMSPVFSSMFELDTDDRNSGRVKVEDASAKCFKEMLRCVYTAQEPELGSDEDLVELLYLSHKYALEPLQAQCARRMVATLTKVNVFKMLKAAYVLKLEFVLKRIVEFVQGNKEVLESEGWRKLQKDDPNTVANILALMVERLVWSS